MLSREFEQVAFTIRNTDLEAEASPAAVDVVVQGPQRVVDQLQLSQDEVFIDAAGKEPGTALIPVTVLVPPEVEIVSQEPKKVSLTLKSRQNEQSKQNEKNESNEQNGQNRLKGEVDDGAGARGEQANTNEG
jgi:YbbR domain-containing protein